MGRIVSIILLLCMVTTVVASGCAAPAPTPTPTPTQAPTQAPTVTSAPKPTTSVPVVTPSPTPTASPKTYTLRFAYTQPPTHWVSILWAKLAKTANERSGGRLNIQNFPSGQLVSGDNAPDMVSTGVVDMVAISDVLWGELNRYVEPYNLPFIFNGSEHVIRAWKAGWGKIAADEWSRVLKVVYVPSILTSGPFYLFTKKPVAVPSDAKGMVLRAPGKSQALLLKNLGIASEAVLTADLYMAAATGLIDGVFIGSNATIAYKLYEYMKYGLLWSSGECGTPTLMNRDKWNQLPPDLQQIITDVWQTSQDQDSFNQAVVLEKGSIEQLKKSGVTFTIPTAEQMALWKVPCQKIWQDWAAPLSHGKEVLDIIEKTRGG